MPAQHYPFLFWTALAFALFAAAPDEAAAQQGSACSSTSNPICIGVDKLQMTVANPLYISGASYLTCGPGLAQPLGCFIRPICLGNGYCQTTNSIRIYRRSVPGNGSEIRTDAVISTNPWSESTVATLALPLGKHEIWGDGGFLSGTTYPAITVNVTKFAPVLLQHQTASKTATPGQRITLNSRWRLFQTDGSGVLKYYFRGPDGQRVQYFEETVPATVGLVTFSRSIDFQFFSSDPPGDYRFELRYSGDPLNAEHQLTSNAVSLIGTGRAARSSRLRAERSGTRTSAREGEIREVSVDESAPRAAPE